MVTNQIGIPNSMLHYETRGVFSRFFEGLGIEVVLSHQTNRSIFELGKQSIVDEFCFPLKVYAGHVAYLTHQQIRPIFVPIISGSANNCSFLCHYQIRLYDIVRSLELVPADALLTGVFTFSGEGLLDEGFYQVGRALGFDDDAIKVALYQARGSHTETRPARSHDEQPCIGVLGHSYILNDPWVSMDIVQKLRDLDCTVVLEDQVCGEIYYPEAVPLHFTLSARMMQAAKTMNAREDIDGIVFLLPFNCGPDSGTPGQLIEEASKPLLIIVLDELTSDAGVVTRLEAFLDMVAARQSAADDYE